MAGFLGRRIAAARELAGFTNRAQLATQINLAGFSGATIGAWERGEETPERHQLREIADACNLPVEFFTVENFDALRNHRVRELEDDLRKLERLRQEDLAAIGELIAQEVARALDVSTLPTDETNGAKETPPEDG